MILTKLIERWWENSLKIRKMKSGHHVATATMKIAARMGAPETDDLTSATLTSYMELRLSEGKANSTINSEIMLIRRVVGWGVKNKLIPPCDLSNIEYLKKPLPRNITISKQQLKNIHKHLQPWTKDITELLFHLPLRVDEAIKMKISWVKLNVEYAPQGYIEIPAGLSKSGRRRIVPLYYPHLKKMLRPRTLGKPGSPVFRREDGHNPGRFNTQWATACRLAGVEGVHLHDLKHTAVTNLLTAGVPQPHVQLIADHSSPTMTAIYNNPSDMDLLAEQKISYDPIHKVIRAG